MKLQVLKIPIHTEESRETIINVWYFSILLQTARSILISLIRTAHFSTTLIVYPVKNRETLCF